MAVTKLWKVSVRLGQVLDYTTNPEKTANPEYSPEDYQALKDVLAYAKDEDLQKSFRGKLRILRRRGLDHDVPQGTPSLRRRAGLL